MQTEPKRPRRGLSLHNRVTLGMASLLAFIFASGLIGLTAVRSTVQTVEEASLSGSKAAIRAAVADAQTARDDALNMILITCGLGAAVVGVMSVRLRRSIHKPLAQLQRGAERFAAGDLDHRIDVRRSDELGEIMDMFNSMASALNDNQQDLAHQAFHDPLTDLPNRELFKDRVEHALARQERDKKPLAVLFVDLDDFKTVNDSLGHAAGDELLVAVAERLHSCVRPGDTAARLGGDEFAVLIEELKGQREAFRVAQRVIDSLQGHFVIEGKHVVVRASVGIAITYGDIEVDALLRNADVAMYAAKGQGKGRYEIFDEKMHVDVVQRLELKTDLERAVEENQFVLHYQPIRSLATGKIVAAEALLRWEHPERGLLYPGSFVELAEETSLILQIGEWVMTEACRQLRWWHQEYNPDLKVSINLSARQFLERGLVEQVARALKDGSVAPSSVILEITEGMLMQDTEATVAKLNRLKELGVELAIDDFGTGYSSLGYLRRFPIDIVKIDQSFTEGVARGPEDSAVARAVIKLGDTLGLRTIAEGIQSRVQVDALTVLGCTEGQGEFLGRAIPSAHLERMMDGDRSMEWSDDLLLLGGVLPEAPRDVPAELPSAPPAAGGVPPPPPPPPL